MPYRNLDFFYTFRRMSQTSCADDEDEGNGVYTVLHALAYFGQHEPLAWLLQQKGDVDCKSRFDGAGSGALRTRRGQQWTPDRS